jgi:hypothetical protein
MTPVPAVVAKVREMGYPLRKQGRSWGGNVCPSCGEGERNSNRLNLFEGRDGKWRFRCHACCAHGDLVDFMVLAKGISLGKAMKEVGTLTTKAPRIDSDDGAEAARLLALRDVVQILVSEIKTVDRFTVAHLTDRGLPYKLLLQAHERGMLRTLPVDSTAARSWLRTHVGDDLLMRSGLMKPGSTWPALAFRPLVFTLPDGGGFECRIPRQAAAYEIKSIRYGLLSKPYSWAAQKGEPPRSVLLVEGAIDLLSVVALGLEPAQIVLGLPGVNAWKREWFMGMKQLYPNLEVRIGFDADEPGDKAAQTLLELCAEVGLSATRIRPHRGKDWNDVLVFNTKLKEKKQWKT